MGEGFSARERDVLVAAYAELQQDLESLRPGLERVDEPSLALRRPLIVLRGNAFPESSMALAFARQECPLAWVSRTGLSGDTRLSS